MEISATILHPRIFKGYDIRRNHLAQWEFPRDLDGVVVFSFEELIRKLPTDELFDNVYLRTRQFWREGVIGFNRYARKRKDTQLALDVAYGCHGCYSIIIGAPYIALWSSGFGLDYFCVNCNGHLYSARWQSLSEL